MEIWMVIGLIIAVLVFAFLLAITNGLIDLTGLAVSGIVINKKIEKRNVIKWMR